MGNGSAKPGLQRHSRFGAIQILDLALFIDTEDHHILRWRQIEAYNVGEVHNEVGILREFEAPRQMGLELMVVQDPLNRALADAMGFGHGTSVPWALSRRADFARRPIRDFLYASSHPRPGAISHCA